MGDMERREMIKKDIFAFVVRKNGVAVSIRNTCREFIDHPLTPGWQRQLPGLPLFGMMIRELLEELAAEGRIALTQEGK